MAADISTSLKDWSTTEASNSPAGSTAISTNLDDNLRQLQSTVRDVWSRTTVASASTCDIGAVDHGSITVSGTTTITSFGTVSEGIRKWLTFSGALTLTHNSTSLILPGGASITTAAGDTACVESLGSGNWRCLAYQPATGRSVNTSVSLSDGTVSAPGLSFTSDTNTGIYRIGADNVGLALGGVKVADLAATAMTFGTSSHTELNLTATASTGNVSALVGSTSGGFRVTNSSGSTEYFLIGPNSGRLQPGMSSSNVGTDLDLWAGDGGSGSSSFLGGEVNIQSGDGYHSGGILLRSKLNNRGTKAGAGYQLISMYAEGTVTAEDVGIQINPDGQVVSFFGVDPSVSSGGGSGATATGNANGFQIVCGTGAGTTIVVGLNVSGPVAPYAVANYRNGTTACRVSATTVSSVTITMGSAPANGDVIDVLLFWNHRETHLA